MTYNPNGAAGGLFAPAYIHGYAPSEQAVADWQASKGGLTRDMIDELRMPDGVEATAEPARQERHARATASTAAATSPTPDAGTDPAGWSIRRRLRALSHGTSYDVGARRDAIAARLLANSKRRMPTAARPAAAWSAAQAISSTAIGWTSAD